MPDIIYIAIIFAICMVMYFLNMHDGKKFKMKESRTIEIEVRKKEDIEASINQELLDSFFDSPDVDRIAFKKV